MYSNRLFIKFCEERNIKESTRKGYVSTLKKYSDFHGSSIDMLIEEAVDEEDKNVPLKERKLKGRLLDYRNFLLNSDMSSNTVKTYFSKLKTFYMHFEIELPYLPDARYGKSYETNHIREALDLVSVDLKALILFMSSSGTAKAETLSLTIGDFIKGTCEYHHGGSVEDVIGELERRDDVVPTFYLKRIKTDKYYYTFCSNEASRYIVQFLKKRSDLKLSDKLFPFSNSLVISKFQEINDYMKWGFKGKYRFFRSHTLRKFHASNIGLAAEYVDALQGRSKSSVHETYIKTNPDKLKEIYVKSMKNILIYDEVPSKPEIKEDIHITINIFLADSMFTL